MKCEELSGRTRRGLIITEVPCLDAIVVVFEDIHAGQGRITIFCYDRVWTAYWGAMGNNTIDSFVRSCHLGYVVDNLVRPYEGKLKVAEAKRERAYLERIVCVVQDALYGRDAPEQGVA